MGNQSRVVAVVFALVFVAAPSYAQSSDSLHKLGPLARARALAADGGWSHVIITAADDSSVDAIAPAIESIGGLPERALGIIHAREAYVPNGILTALAANPLVSRISLNRATGALMERTGATVGATVARELSGLSGAGIGVAVIDSGITGWHDDLGDGAGGQRVVHFVDFVHGAPGPYDDHGHGTHVAGIIAGNGFDSDGHRSGIAPAASLVVLKVLDATGRGRIGDVIAALDYVVANREALNIRVVNLSVGTGVYESYDVDPLTLAAKRAVDAGVVVVVPAGNAGRNPEGVTMYAGTTAPGNAPWVLTVGAASHLGTVDRADDAIAVFSSRGPTAVDFIAKPDIVAPGVGIESLSAPGSTLYYEFSQYLLDGTVPTWYLPYLSLSGTSMSSPVVAGTVALMLEANPALTPNAVKAILQYTAQRYPGYDALTQGTGFLNAKGAVQLAQYFANPTTDYPTDVDWTGRLEWGTRMVGGGRITPGATAWSAGITWGSAAAPDNQPIEWGLICSLETCAGSSDGWISWGLAAAGDSENVVWGVLCGGDNCTQPWTVAIAGAVATSDGSADTIVWGTDDADTIVWGTSDDDTIVWGTACSDACAPVLWNQP